MRVALITESGYPYRPGSLSSWCRQLIRGLDGHTFQVIALTDRDSAPPAGPLPANLTQVTPVPVWEPPAPGPRRISRRTRRAATAAAALLCQGMHVGENQASVFRDGLVRLTRLAEDGGHPLAGVPLARILATTWRAAGAEPPLGPADAHTAAVLLEHALRPLSVPAPDADLTHPTSSGLALLVALAAKWREGVPFLLTELGVYLRQRYLDYRDRLSPAVRAVMLAFFRALAGLGYTEAAVVVAGSRFTQRWQIRHGAHPGKVVVIPAGVDPAEFPVRPEPTTPTVVWVGRIEPLQDLDTVLEAFYRVRWHLPAARLRVVGPVADVDYHARCQQRVRRLGLTRAVEFTGKVTHPAPAYASGQVVVRSGTTEGVPYPVLEAMMSGRATVSTDVGAAAEVVGDAGLLVPAGDPAALSQALVTLLTDARHRRALAAAAIRRVQDNFPIDLMLRAYRHVYLDVADRAGQRRSPAVALGGAR